MQHYASEIKENKIQNWIRRAGPNYVEGRCKGKVAGDKLGLVHKVYSP